MQALFTLTPAESKRLIAKAVAAMPEVRKAKQEGYLIIGRGSTNAYIAEELLSDSLEKEKYVAGQVIKGIFCALDQGIRIQPITFHKDKVLSVDPAELIGKLGSGDVLLKGANAVDHKGNIGVVMASPVGGTMGQFYMAMKAQGAKIIYPVGLEKLIPSVELAAKFGGRLAIDRSIGAKVGLACVTDGKVITEIQSLNSLFGVRAVHFASGGYGGAEGSVTLIVEGGDDDVNKCVNFVETVKGEPPLPAAKGPCKTCPILCSFQGREEGDLPVYLR
ncbi:MAG TPA: hypothetical protein ENO00_04135 [Deltaproteobacteria bacterium]|nr:hypothetical protein [Deltaproteobacteria bacterium]